MANISHFLLLASFPPTLSHPLSAICSRLRAHNHCAPFVFDMSPAPRRPIRSSFQWSTADDWVISGFNLGDVHVAHSTDGWVHIVKVALP